jgi:hypothetical protein
MSYYLKVLKDNPIGFWTLDETSGTVALDSSACANNGTYIGTPEPNLMPLVPGGRQGTRIDSSRQVSFPITKGYYGSALGGGVMNSSCEDNDFSLEIWFYPNIIVDQTVSLFADSSSSSGIYYKDGNIIFSVGGQSAYYSVENIERSHHIVCSYTGNSLKIYHDGVLVTNKLLSDKINLTNTSTTFVSGPTNSSNYLIIDAPAVYRYALTNDQVYSHYVFGKPSNPSQIASPYSAMLFSLNDENLKKSFSYSYPFDKSWENFASENTYFNKSDQSLSIIPSNSVESKTTELIDYITIPEDLGMAYSKIEWSATRGVSIETSSDGFTYIACENKQSIPQYKNLEFSNGKLYIKITLSTTDASKEVPKISYLNISFYKSQDLYADNFGEKIVPVGEEYFLGGKNYRTLSRDKRSGLLCQTGGSFSLNTSKVVTAIDFFYTPYFSSNGGLISGIASYRWVGGTISKTNIAAIYINGVDKTSETLFTSTFTIGETYHVFIKLATPAAGEAKFNHSSGGQSPASYKNIIIYDNEIPEYMPSSNYSFYTERNAISVSASDTAISVTEGGYYPYNNDWVILESQ